MRTLPDAKQIVIPLKFGWQKTLCAIGGKSVTIMFLGKHKVSFLNVLNCRYEVEILYTS